MNTFVRIEGAHCGDCGAESVGLNVNLKDDGSLLWGPFYPELPHTQLPYPVIAPRDAVAAVAGVYDCELCGGRVLAAIDPA